MSSYDSACFSNKKAGAFFGVIILLITGILVIFANLATLLNPRAYAIHQLITDAL